VIATRQMGASFRKRIEALIAKTDQFTHILG